MEGRCNSSRVFSLQQDDLTLYYSCKAAIMPTNGILENTDNPYNKYNSTLSLALEQSWNHSVS